MWWGDGGAYFVCSFARFSRRQRRPARRADLVPRPARADDRAQAALRLHAGRSGHRPGRPGQHHRLGRTAALIIAEDGEGKQPPRRLDGERRGVLLRPQRGRGDSEFAGPTFSHGQEDAVREHPGARATCSPSRARSRDSGSEGRRVQRHPRVGADEHRAVGPGLLEHPQRLAPAAPSSARCSSGASMKRSCSPPSARRCLLAAPDAASSLGGRANTVSRWGSVRPAAARPASIRSRAWRTKPGAESQSTTVPSATRPLSSSPFGPTTPSETGGTLRWMVERDVAQADVAALGRDRLAAQQRAHGDRSPPASPSRTSAARRSAASSPRRRGPGRRAGGRGAAGPAARAPSP